MTIANAPNTRPGPADDTGDGLLMFLVFVAAVLTSTATVAAIALVGTWWMLGFGFAIHVIMTAVVILTIVHAMAGRQRSIGDRRALLSTSSSPRRFPADSHQAGAGTTTGLTRGSPAIGPGTGTHTVAVEGHLTPRARWGPNTRGPGLRPDRSQMARRVLVVTDENLAFANEVPEAILAQIEQPSAQGGQAAEVFVIAPTLTTRLQSLTGDIDGARASADERLRTVFDHMDASGLEFAGAVGGEDQVTAIADALDGFDADLILLRLHAPGSQNENWREHRLVDWVRAHTTVPTIVSYFDDEGQFVGREEAIAPVAAAA